MSIEFCSNEVLDALLAVSPEYWVADYGDGKWFTVAYVYVWFGYEMKVEIMVGWLLHIDF